MEYEPIEELRKRLAAAEAERDELRARVNADLNDTVTDWLVSVVAYATVVPDVHNTVSWRVTRPLRLVRTFQLKVSQVGLRPAVGIVASRARRRLARGRTH